MKQTPRAATAPIRGKAGAIALALALIGAIATSVLGGSRAAAAQVLHLPYPGGVGVQIIQGYNGSTHVGVERYSLDLVRTDGATSGSPVLAPASGSVDFAQTPYTENGCIAVSIDGSDGFNYMLCHLYLLRSYNYNEPIQQGQMLGTVAPPGQMGNNGTAHVHMQLFTLPGGIRTPAPYAQPNGMTLEGASMPPDGSYNQWACSGSSCRNLMSANAPIPQSAARPGSASSSGTDSAAPPTPPAPPAAPTASSTFAAGQPVTVQGTGDCLRVHAQPALAATIVTCIPDATPEVIASGPVSGDGISWWDLAGLGWAASGYLQPDGNASGSPISAPASSASTVTPPTPPSSPTPAMAVGTTVQVTGTGDCLRAHDQAGIGAYSVACIPDGTVTTIVDGPVSTDGHSWWKLDGIGWVVADYLTPAPHS